MTQAHILYSGTVQGVGFRYTVCHYARNLGLKGWVKNLSDGRVEMFVEGPQNQIDIFCQKIDQHFQGYIRDKEVGQDIPNGQFRDFQIVY